jgi:hypothetical protein
MYDMGNLPKQDHKDTEKSLLLDFKSHDGTISANFKSCVPTSRPDIIMASPTASSCCTTMPIPMWPTVQEQLNTMPRELLPDHTVNNNNSTFP